MREAVLYYNPAAGRFPLSERRLRNLLERLYRLGIRCDPVPATRPVSESPLNLEGKQLLIVYGGDGTIHQALTALVRWDVPLGILPAGTANVLARELGVPLDPDRAVAVLTRGEPRRVCLGRADHRYFLLMAGVGLDGFVIRRVTHRFKKRLGVAAYWVMGLASLWRYPFVPFELEVDSTFYEATFAVVANASRYGGHLRIAPQASLFEDTLDVCMFTGASRLLFMRYLLAVLRGKHLDCPGVLYRKGRAIRIRGDQSIPVQMDGELGGCLPLSFDSARQRIQVMVPRRIQEG